MTKLVPLTEAVRALVRPGMHLNFASTPSRSNAAIRELARVFRGTRPGFELSATGFHSTAHLLGLLRLGRRYVGCFFGDNYPTPRPNRLYAELHAEGYELEHWSLWSYVAALSAGAFGQPFAVTRSLSGTDLGRQLQLQGKFFELPSPDGSETPLGLVRALVPDIVFLHAALGDAEGNVVLTPPECEGVHGALAARQGVIVTVERVAPAELLRELAHFRPLPAHRVLAVCEEPFGAHPQPLHVPPAGLDLASYRDDFEGYAAWRAMTEDPSRFARFTQQVLEARDGAAGYREFVGPARLQALSTQRSSYVRSARAVTAAAPPLSSQALEPSDDLVLLAGRALARRVREAGHRAILAGIGQSFAASRFAAQLLAGSGEGVELMVETGFAGVDPERAEPFLLSHANVATAARLGSVASVLGSLCCGGAAACIGVIGAAEVDLEGNVNSSWVGGELLVGSGGASDIAAAAREVMVLTRADPKRLVRKVEFITSRGANVRCIVTEACVFERKAAGEPWIVREILASRVEGLERLLSQSGFRFAIPGPPPLAPPPSERELRLLSSVRWPERAGVATAAAAVVGVEEAPRA